MTLLKPGMIATFTLADGSSYLLEVASQPIVNEGPVRPEVRPADDVSTRGTN